jgi:hypothetical protein
MASPIATAGGLYHWSSASWADKDGPKVRKCGLTKTAKKKNGKQTTRLGKTAE